MAKNAKSKKPKMEKGGSLAGKYGDPDKITRGDIITAAKENAGKMKKGGTVKAKKK